MKLHLACGDIYLAGYTNVDIEGEIGVSPNPTTLDKYYEGREIGKPQKKYVDMLCDVSKLPGDIEADEIVAIQVLEHFPQAEVVKVLRKWYLRLKKGGHLLLSVPDLHRSLLLEDNFAIRLVYGSQKNKHSYHLSGFTKNTLSAYLSIAGFKKIEFGRYIQHDYPTIQTKAYK